MIYFGIGCLENADLENADLANKDLENTDMSQTQKQPLLASVMNLSPLVRLLFFFSRSVVCVFETPELKQPRRRGQQKRDKFSYLRWKTLVLQALNEHFSFLDIFADVLVLSTTWNDLFCSCVDDVSIWWQMVNFVCLSPVSYTHLTLPTKLEV